MSRAQVAFARAANSVADSTLGTGSTAPAGVKGFLESNGIAAVVRGEFLTSGWGELPVDVCSVWVSDDAQYDRAHALLVSFLKGDSAREFRGQAWRCPRCGEQLEGQFTTCWSCGAPKP